MNEANSTFAGCIPAVMTPCDKNGNILFDRFVGKGHELINEGMSALVSVGSMGNWPLLTRDRRFKCIEALCEENLPVIVGTGAQNTADAVAVTEHGVKQGAKGFMMIPKMLHRASNQQAQFNHFSRILEAAGDLPCVVYNSPYYGFEMQPDLFFRLRDNNPNLVGFKEFGGRDSLTRDANNITLGDQNLSLLVGVDTQVYHGFVNCGAVGAITGIGNALPKEVLTLISLCKKAAEGHAEAEEYAHQLSRAMHVLSQFDETPDLVLYYKYILFLDGDDAYEHHFEQQDQLTPSQKKETEQALSRFRNWWESWYSKDIIDKLCN